MKTVQGGLTKPKGFKANGLAAGIKANNKKDLGLIFSECPAVAAGVFTKNSIIAAPLVVTKKHIRNQKAQAIVVNSGNANCFTGKFGLTYAQDTAEWFADLLNISTDEVLVASTGIIGKTLPFNKIIKSSKELVNGLSQNGSKLVAESILTTDLVTKEIAVQIPIAGQTVTIGGCAKGSGMIAPNMATMLGFITTDAAISPKLLKSALKEAVDRSFNCISVDGCMSTNDMVVILANGQAKNKKISTTSKDFETFKSALNHVCLELAKKIVYDGEGATKFIEITVSSAKTFAQARALGLQVANSNLVKTACFGSDPNWGRIAGALGSLGMKDVKEDKMKISFSSFKNKHQKIHVELGIGHEEAVVYTSDLSHGYIDINVNYN